MPTLDRGGIEIFCTTSRGPSLGPSLVLVHGAGGSRLNWPAGLRRLPGATVHTLDLPGHGRSGTRGHDAIERYAEAIIGFLDAVGVDQAVVVGHSMGGAIALTLALDFPNRVGGLVLVASGARLRVEPTILEGLRTDYTKAVEEIARSAWAPGTPPAMVELGQKAMRKVDPCVVMGDFVACDRFDVMERLPEVKAPTLVISGSADLHTPVKYARFLCEHIPRAHLVIVEGAGHMVTLERPAEVIQAVSEFLGNITDSTPGKPGRPAAGWPR